MASEFALGHAGEKYGYDKSHLEEKWCKIVERELGKMTDVLNLKTGVAQAYYASKEDELRAQILKDAYRALIETGAMKPEHLWDKAILEVVCKKVGVTYNDLMIARADGKPDFLRTAVFERLADAIKLSPEVKERYLEAFKVLRPANATVKWENHSDYYIRTEIGTDDYMTALTDDYKVVDSDGKVRILAKPKASITGENTKSGTEVGGQ